MYSSQMGLLLLFFVPFLGTLLGSVSVFVLQSGLGIKTSKVITGFAGGVMIAACIWSLLLPAIEVSSYYLSATGFLCGIALLLLLDTIVPHIHATAEKAEGKDSRLSKSALLMLAVTLHNIPEGMAVGAAAAAAAAHGGIAYTSALALSLGIAIQNFPEGLIVSMPLYKEEKKKAKAFALGTLSGIVEPIGALAAYVFVSSLSSLLPFLLSFAAGAMFYVVVEELIPEASEGEHSNIGTIGAAIGFVLMMVLDGVLG